MLRLGRWQVGFVVEVSEDRLSEVVEAYNASGVEAFDIGRVTDDGKVFYDRPTLNSASASKWAGLTRCPVLLFLLTLISFPLKLRHS